MKKTQRKADDPLNYIQVECKIPQSLKYDINSMSLFNFTD